MRFLTLLCLVASVTFAQTYVRPSKGKSFEPFVDGGASDYAGTGASGWSSYPALPMDGGNVSAMSPAYDWTAFSGLQLTVTVDTTPTDFQQKFSFSDLGAYVKFRAYSQNINRIGTTYKYFFMEVLESSSPSGPFTLAPEQPAIDMYVSAATPLAATDLLVKVTPIPFTTAPSLTSNTGSAPIDIRGTTPDCLLLLTSSWTGSGGAGLNADPIGNFFAYIPVRSGSSSWPLTSSSSNRGTMRVCNSRNNAYSWAYCYDAKLRDGEQNLINPSWALGQFYGATAVANVVKYVQPIAPGECLERYWNGRIFSDWTPNDVVCLASPDIELNAELCVH